MAARGLKETLQAWPYPIKFPAVTQPLKTIYHKGTSFT